MSKQDTGALIEELSGELCPVKRLGHPLKRAVPWVLFSFIYLGVVSAILGIRDDLADKINDTAFMLENSFMLLMSITAALSAAWLSVPDARGQKWLTIVPVALLAGFTLWSGIRAWAEGMNMHVVHWGHCFSDSLMMGLIPAAFMVMLARRGATTHPLLMTAMNVLAITGLGYIGLRLVCSVDTVGHSGIYHLLPFVVFGAIFGFAARRVFRW